MNFPSGEEEAGEEERKALFSILPTYLPNDSGGGEEKERERKIGEMGEEGGRQKHAPSLLLNLLMKKQKPCLHNMATPTALLKEGGGRRKNTATFSLLPV